MPSIYERIGEEATINATTELFYKKVLADDKINHFFKDTNMDNLIAKQNSFFNSVLGGGGDYNGRSMRDAHSGLKITDEDFQIVATHLQATLVELTVPADLVAEVMAVVATTYD